MMQDHNRILTTVHHLKHSPKAISDQGGNNRESNYGKIRVIKHGVRTQIEKDDSLLEEFVIVGQKLMLQSHLYILQFVHFVGVVHHIK